MGGHVDWERERGVEGGGEGGEMGLRGEGRGVSMV